MSYWWCLKHCLDWMDFDWDLKDLMENVETAILDEKDNNVQSRCLKKLKSLKPIVRQAYQDNSNLIKLLTNKENKWDDLTRNGSFGKNVQSMLSGFKYVMTSNVLQVILPPEQMSSIGYLMMILQFVKHLLIILL